MFNLLKVKLWINDLVPDDADPGGGDEEEQDSVDEHVDNPEYDMRSGVVGGEDEDDTHAVEDDEAGNNVPLEERIWFLDIL